MIRTNKVEANQSPQGKIRWINNGGTFRFRKNEIIKPGARFTAYPEEIPQAFRDVIVALDPYTAANDAQDILEVNAPRPVYTLNPVEDNEGFFDIINGKGKKMNETPLDEATAKQLISDLQS